MKNHLNHVIYIICFILTLVALRLNGQEKMNQSATLRTIAVTGIAEQEIVPDVIYFTISLKEYALSNGSKLHMQELENQLVAAVTKAGIKAENLKVENVFGYNYNWQKQKSKDFMARKQFQLKLSDAKSLTQILSFLDPRGIESARISQYTHSKIEEINQKLQVEAVKNAHQKAIALLAPLNEKVGKVIEVQENSRGYQPIYYYKNHENHMRTMAMVEDENMASDIEFRNIKLEAEIHIVFSIE